MGHRRSPRAQRCIDRGRGVLNQIARADDPEAGDLRRQRFRERPCRR